MAMGVPQNGWFVRENPTNPIDIWGFPEMGYPQMDGLQGKIPLKNG